MLTINNGVYFGFLLFGAFTVITAATTTKNRTMGAVRFNLKLFSWGPDS